MTCSSRLTYGPVDFLAIFCQQPNAATLEYPMFRMWRPWLRHARAELARPRHVWPRCYRFSIESSGLGEALSPDVSSWSVAACRSCRTSEHCLDTKDSKEVLLAQLPLVRRFPFSLLKHGTALFVKLTKITKQPKSLGF